MGKTFIGPRAARLEAGRAPEAVSRVTLLADGETRYTAGNDTGRTIEKTVPWASQAMAESLLARLQSVRYQPFQAEDALLDPASEVGDGVTVGGVYSVLARADVTFDGLYSADIAAPGGDEVEDEYPYKSRARRQSEREMARIRSSITKTAERITLMVENQVEGLTGRIELTASSLTTEINKAREGLNSKIEQTASAIAARVSTAEGDIGSLQLTANSLLSEISSANGNISRIDQRVDSIGLSVDGSSLTLTKDGVSVSHAIRAASLHGDVVYLYSDRGQIGAQFNVGDASSAADRCELWARAIMLGTNGGHIYLDAGNATLEVGDNELHAGGNLIPSRGNMYQCGSAAFPWRDVYSQDGTISSSDRAGKTDIRYDLEKYAGLFDRLRPCTFQRKNGTSGRRHHGFIAQEVREALAAEGMTGKDFAGYVDWEDGGSRHSADAEQPLGHSGTAGTPGFGLRYEELIAMLVHEVQQLKRRLT